MSINKGDRKQSRAEFDNTYFIIHEDARKQYSNHFGARGEIYEENKDYIRMMGLKILDSVIDTGKEIRIANSIYPKTDREYAERRLAQEKAIGNCFDILTKYQLMMKTLKIPDDKYTEEIKHIIHEINCLKRWRDSDTKRFKNIG